MKIADKASRSKRTPGPSEPLAPSSSSPTARFARAYGIVMVLGAVMLLAAVGVNGFASAQNLLNILRAVSFSGIVAVGMTFVILGGYYADLSVPSTVSAAALLAIGLQEPFGPLLACIVALLGGALVGLLNGAVVVVGGNPIIVTLGSQTLLSGVIVAATAGSFSYGTSAGFASFGKLSLGAVPVQVLMFLCTVVLAQLVLERTRFGFWFYATGGNARAAHVSGVPTRLMAVCAFVASGLTAAVAGVLLAAFNNQASSAIGSGYEFTAIAAVVVGGTSLFGGFGNVWRTLVGVLLVGTIDNIGVLMGFAFESRLLITGITIVAAVWIDSSARRRSS